MSVPIKSNTKDWRVTEAIRDGDALRVRFVDGESVAIPLVKIAPKKGTPDWSRISIHLKGAHIAVPVVGGDFPEHEIPWDVLRWFLHPVW